MQRRQTALIGGFCLRAVSKIRTEGIAQHVAQAVAMVRSSDILDESYGVARDFRDRAIAALAGLPRDDARSSLGDIAEYVLERRS